VAVVLVRQRRTLAHLETSLLSAQQSVRWVWLPQVAAVVRPLAQVALSTVVAAAAVLLKRATPLVLVSQRKAMTVDTV
jgi:hypothetical protein